MAVFGLIPFRDARDAVYELDLAVDDDAAKFGRGIFAASERNPQFFAPPETPCVFKAVFQQWRRRLNPDNRAALALQYQACSPIAPVMSSRDDLTGRSYGGIVEFHSTSLAFLRTFSFWVTTHSET